MKIIEGNIVDTTWREVGSFSENQARQSMSKLGERQTELLSFVTTSMEELRPEAIELGIYIFFVIYRMFEKSTKVKFKRISAKKMISVFKSNEEMLSKLDIAHDKFIEKIGKIEISKQPFVMKYLVEAIMEADQDLDPVFLSEGEIGSIFLILKTVVDVLDATLNKGSRN